MPRYNYHVVPFVGRIKANTAENAQTVSTQLQAVIDHYAKHGWEFYSIEKVGIEVNPGCLGGLFGQSATYLNYDQIIFRRAATG
jgi:hypothetical protein